MALKDIFNYYPDHNIKHGVLAKIALLDRIYATNLNKSVKDIAEFADEICKINDIDNRLRKGDHSLVDEISLIVKDKRLFSFATKYCYLHNCLVYGKDDFSIVDSCVKYYLPRYLKEAKKTGKRVDYVSKYKLEIYQKMGNYTAIVKSIDNLLNEYQINSKNKRRAFDIFIWLQGKNIKF